jgi:hypothetical protein
MHEKSLGRVVKCPVGSRDSREEGSSGNCPLPSDKKISERVKDKRTEPQTDIRSQDHE